MPGPNLKPTVKMLRGATADVLVDLSPSHVSHGSLL